VQGVLSRVAAAEIAHDLPQDFQLQSRLNAAVRTVFRADIPEKRIPSSCPPRTHVNSYLKLAVTAILEYKSFHSNACFGSSRYVEDDDRILVNPDTIESKDFRHQILSSEIYRMKMSLVLIYFFSL